MAMTCISGARECTGCMACQEQEAICECAVCGEGIYDGDDILDLRDFNIGILHQNCKDDCFREYERVAVLERL